MAIDIIRISKVEKIFNKHGQKFLEKVFNDQEILHIQKKAFRAQTMAGIFSAKEAVLKEIGTGIKGHSLKDVNIFYDSKGKPFGSLFKKTFDISISHEGDYALASALKKDEDFFEVDDFFKGLLKKRKDDSHKGDYGKLAIISGSKGMIGCSLFASGAALRSGIGLAYLLARQDYADSLSVISKEAIVKVFKNKEEEVEFLSGMDAILMGPGIYVDKKNREILTEILKMNKKVLLDASSFDLLKDNLDLLKSKADKVLTPHLGEFSKLTNISIEEIKKNKLNLAKSFAKEQGVVLVLKGHKTIVTDGDRLYENHTGNPAMAKAGSGDVLSGIIAALMPRIEDTFMASALGVYIHGLAGDFAAEKLGQESVLARDLISNIYKVFKFGQNLYKDE